MIELFYILSENKKYFSFENRNINLSQYVSKVSRDDIFDYINFLECQNYDGLNLEDIYIYDNMPIYFFFRGTLYARIEHLFNCIKTIEKLTNEFLNKKIKVFTDSSMMFNVAKELFELECIKIKPKSKSPKQVEFQNNDELDRRIKRGIHHLSEFKKQFLHKKNFLVFSHAMDLNIVTDKISGEQFYYDTQLGCVLDKLKDEYNVFNIQLCNESSLDKSIECNIDYYPYEEINKIVNIDNIKIENDMIIVNNEILKTLNYNYNNLKLEKIICYNFFNDYKEICNNELKKVLIFMKICKELKIEKCIIMDETYSGRPLVFTANKLQIKNYAIQHGMITNKRFSQFINSKYGNIIAPTKTFVWGKVFKEKLISNGNIYSNNNVSVSGQVKTDIIYNYYFNRKKQENKLFNNNAKFNILYVTQNEEDIYKPATEMLFKALKNLDESYNLIIKLHPADNNYDFYNYMIKQYNISNINVVENCDMFLLIEWCDMIINAFSTVTQEALIFNKKSICILLPKYGDTSGYIKNKIALEAKDEHELLYNIKILKQENTINNKVINKFIENNFYKVDGLVTERIVKSIIED